MTTTKHSPPPLELPVGLWRIDPVHSTVGFEVRDMTHLIATIHGRFTDFEGSLDVTSTGAHAQGTVRVESLTTDNSARDADLRSSQFLDATTAPEIGFESESIEAAGSGTFHISGRLTFKGTVSDIELDGVMHGSGTDHSGNERLAIAATGLLPFGPMQVKLVLDVSAIKAS